ncbi:unnamed protein product [Pieris macdunnoughi]|uniref:Lipase n=1 Tax=Pieris macdunnoughi TaxID=345717 RepID=A0A821VL91_9NEOP|nr:unnamed protein product [Pieris macdunnoughi]
MAGEIILLLTIKLCVLSTLSENTAYFSIQYGHPAEEYHVITEDGYILGIFHLPGYRGLPLLLMHGIMDSSDSWIIRGNNSLGISLANLGYDVWLGNCRGNLYSRRHVYLDADNDASAYWNFSFHEHGLYDLPAIIDFVLSRTGTNKLNAIGFSQGNTIFYVMASLRPQYNDRVNLLISLAPIAFLRNLGPPLSLLIDVSSDLITIGRSLQQYEVFGNSLTGFIHRGICSLPFLGYFLCSFGFVFPIAGYDLLEYDYDFHYKVTRMKFPMSISLKNLNHFAQIRKRGRFSQFDYGDGNIEVYGSVEPPDYDLRKVTMSVALLCGQNDKLARQKDVEVLKEALRNTVQFTLLEYKEMNHVDFTWGKNMDKYLFPYILQILNKSV